MLNVLHLVSGRSFTGPVAAALADVRSLQAAGHRAWLGSRSGSALETGCAAQDVPFAGGFKFGKGPARLLHLPHDARRLRHLCREHEVDIVHVHRSQEQVLARWALRRQPGLPVVRTWHRDPGAVAAPLRRHLAAAVSGHVCVAREHIKALRDAGVQSASYLPPAVDAERFRPMDRSGNEARRIGLIGRWKAGEDRGQRAFLDVLRRLSVETGWRGVLLGRGEGRGELAARIAAHPYYERIELLETNEQFARQVAALDIGLVFATGSDGTSRPAVEMLACGVPVLLADRPGLRELGEENRGARVLPEQDLLAWAHAIDAWLRAPEECLQAGAAARRVAEERHALAARGRELAVCYTTLLGLRSRP